jgi:hypothetical protein
MKCIVDDIGHLTYETWQEARMHERVQSRHRIWDRGALRWQDCVAIESCYRANGPLAIVFFSLGFRASRPLLQAMCYLQ